jgi:hypothetical protein
MTIRVLIQLVAILTLMCSSIGHAAPTKNATISGPLSQNTIDEMTSTVKGFYIDYLDSSGKPLGPDLSSLDIVDKYASPSLHQLISNYDKCQIRTQDACNVDFDIVVNGQDWTLKQLPTLSNTSNGTGRVDIATSFISDDIKMRVVYDFIHEPDDSWKIDNVEGIAPAPAWSLKILLAHEPK